MQVYIEDVILDNLIIDYLLLKYTRVILKKKCVIWQLLLFAAVGAAFAVVLPLLQLSLIWQIVARIAFSFFYTYISSNCKNLKEYISYFLVFMGLTFVCGGGVLGIFYILKTDYNKGTELFGLPVGLIILFAYSVIMLINSIVKYIYRRKDIVCFSRTCAVTNCGKSLKLEGFIDSGNNVYDKNGNAVVFCSKQTAMKLADFRHAFGSVSVSTVNGNSVLPTFKVDKLVIYSGTKENIIENINFAVTNTGRLGGECDLILPIGIIGGEYENKTT